MATQLQIRRGTSAQVAAFTGAEGEVVVNTTNDSIHVNDGSTAGGFELARVDGSNWAITNNISTTANISFGDNDKAIFGAGSDLQIYSDGDSSYLKENSATGSLFVDGDNIRFRTSDGSKSYALFTNSGSARLYHDNSIKIETTSTGIDVTGTATMDGLTVDSGTVDTVATFQSSGDANAYVVVKDSGSSGGAFIGAVGTHTILGTGGNTERMRIDSSGNLLVGKTSPDNTTAGTTIYGPVAKGAASFVRDAGNTLVLNRLTSDGEILAFRKDGSTVGSIGTYSGTLTVNSANTGIMLDDTNNVLRPTNASGGSRDAIISLGTSSQRFKDLRLSNQIIGGFGAATTSGTADWNHSTNARSGMGQTLLFGTATNGPGPNAYYHATSFEYSSKDGTGNMTQLAIGYNTNRIFMRNRYNNSWSSWVEK